MKFYSQWKCLCIDFDKLRLRKRKVTSELDGNKRNHRSDPFLFPVYDNYDVAMTPTSITLIAPGNDIETARFYVNIV